MDMKPQRIDPAFCAAATARLAQFIQSLDDPPDLERVSEPWSGCCRVGHRLTKC